MLGAGPRSLQSAVWWLRTVFREITRAARENQGFLFDLHSFRLQSSLFSRTSLSVSIALASDFSIFSLRFWSKPENRLRKFWRERVLAASKKALTLAPLTPFFLPSSSMIHVSRTLCRRRGTCPCCGGCWRRGGAGRSSS